MAFRVPAPGPVNHVVTEFEDSILGNIIAKAGQEVSTSFRIASLVEIGQRSAANSHPRNPIHEGKHVVRCCLEPCFRENALE